MLPLFPFGFSAAKDAESLKAGLRIRVSGGKMLLLLLLLGVAAGANHRPEVLFFKVLGLL